MESDGVTANPRVEMLCTVQGGVENHADLQGISSPSLPRKSFAISVTGVIYMNERRLTIGAAFILAVTSLNASRVHAQLESTKPKAAPISHPTPAIQDKESAAQRDARMAWWREARFGMFIHWGLYSIPAGAWNGK